MFFVYIIANKPNGTLYIGQTSSLLTRMGEHKEGKVDGFSRRYNLDKLMWYDVLDTRRDAIQTERRMKAWYRPWKVELIIKENPDWRDLTDDLSFSQ